MRTSRARPAALDRKAERDLERDTHRPHLSYQNCTSSLLHHKVDDPIGDTVTERHHASHVVLLIVRSMELQSSEWLVRMYLLTVLPPRAPCVNILVRSLGLIPPISVPTPSFRVKRRRERDLKARSRVAEFNEGREVDPIIAEGREHDPEFPAVSVRDLGVIRGQEGLQVFWEIWKSDSDVDVALVEA